MKKLLLAVLLISSYSASMAQINEGGKPLGLRYTDQLQEVVFERMPTVDVEILLAEDEINYPEKVGPYRFGEKHFISMTLENSGQWETLPNGDRIWRLGVVSEDAFSLNFIFENFHLPTGGKLFIYNEETRHVIGAFTENNNRQDGWFGTFLLKGDQAVIEYIEPLDVQGQGSFELKEIIHGYRDILGWYKDDARAGGSGSCNIDVACPLGDGWDDQINSVGIMISGGSGFCTGAMVADVPQSGTPYFLTANHCGTGAGNWSVGFNYQLTGCNSGGASQDYGSLSGGTRVAWNAGSDFALVRWDNSPPEEYNVFYAGWSNINTAATQTTGIHHPSGDLKKISRDNGTVSNSTYSGAETWRVGAWEQGTTEPGSSGSPLFDANKRIIGQLYGGSASCSLPNDPDFYGKFSTSWDGSSSNRRLRDWLDPNNTGTTTVAGYDPFASTFSYEAQLTAITEPSNGAVVCETSVAPVITIQNNGSVTLNSVTVNYTINGTNGSTQWSGSLATGSSTSFTLPNLNLNTGSNSLSISLSNPNGQQDEDNSNNSSSVTFNSTSGDSFVTLILNLDDYGSETTWQLAEDGGAVIASGGPYNDFENNQIEEEICVSTGDCYTFTIFDSFQDGICCYTGTQNPNYQDGNYSIGDEDGISIYTGSEFGAQEEVDFCVPANSGGCMTAYDPFESNASGIALYPNGGGGYIAGSNSFGDLAKAQEFAAPGQTMEIEGIIAWIAGKADAGASVTANLYALDGPGSTENGNSNNAPNTVLATTTKTLARVDTTGFLTRFEFTNPVQVSTGFAVGLNFSGFGNDDELGIVSNADGDANGSENAWEQWSGGDWHTMQSAWSQVDGDFDLGLFPIMCTATVTGLEDLSYQFGLFPNPNNGAFTVVNSNQLSGNLEVFNSLGKLMSSGAIQGESNLDIDLESVDTGVYFVRVTTDTGVWNTRVVINQ